jgi:uncharacterized protein YxjI
VTRDREGDTVRRARYQVPRRPADLGRFGVRTEAGELALVVHAAPPDALVLEHPAGGECCTIHEASYGLQLLMRISRRGHLAAWISKLVVGPVREHYTIDLGVSVLEVRGSPRDYEYALCHGWRTVATVSRTRAGASEAYGVEVARGQDDALILAVTVCLALMSGGAGVPVPPALSRVGEPVTAIPKLRGP